MWPSRSPDLTVSYFHLWGYLKNKVYARNHHTLDELKDYIRTEINLITEQQLMRANQSFLLWCRKCVDVGGQHFQHLLSQGTLFSLFIIMHKQSERSAVQLLCLGGASRLLTARPQPLLPQVRPQVERNSLYKLTMQSDASAYRKMPPTLWLAFSLDYTVPVYEISSIKALNELQQR